MRLHLSRPQPIPVLCAYACAFAFSVLLTAVTFDPAAAQLYTGYVTVYADASGASCSLLDDVPRTFVQFGILVHDCNFDVYLARTRGPLYVNPDGGCPPWCVVPTRQTTWGGVKALYRD